MKIFYFAWVRQKIGSSEETVTLPSHIHHTGELLDWLKDRHPQAREALSQRNVIRVAKNQEYCSWDETISDQDEIAFFPPVTGG